MIIIKTGSSTEELEVTGYAENRHDAQSYLFNNKYKHNKNTGMYEDDWGYLAKIESVPNIWDV